MRKLAAALTIALLAAVCVAPIAAAQSPTASTQPTDQSQLLSAGQLDALVAPIALYPDALLSEILMASTYPLEIVEADRWVNANKNLKGDALRTAVDQQGWDDSVKSLVATPSVLDMMSQRLSWTQQLGDAVLAQQPDVMDAIQRLRAKAQANGKLASNQQQTVTTEQQPDGGETIVIAPTDPDMLYVPYYDPDVVYGPWPYPDYPAYYWPPPGYIAAGIIATGIAFGAGYALARWFGGRYWGSGFGWYRHNINRGGGHNWVHDPAHRQGVRYSNPGVAARFGGYSAGGVQNRLDFRGRAGNQVLQPGVGNRPNIPIVGRPAGGRPNIAVVRPTGGAIGNISSGRAANFEAIRGRASLGGGGFHIGGGGGGGFHAGGGGGGFRGGGGGGRRSDIRLKHDIVMLGRLEGGIGFYRFIYNGGSTAYVGVMAQEVETVRPDAVTRGADGYLRVSYDKLGLTFQTYDDWVASGARLPATMMAH